MELEGVLPVVQTPFDEREQIDWSVLRREVRWVLEHGANGVVAAMVSEWLKLTREERVRYMRELVDAVSGQGVVVASVGAEWTGEAVWYAEQAERAGCTAVMAIPPTTQRLEPDELFGYFAAIAEATALPLIVQDASSYVGTALPLELMVRLVERYGASKIFFKPEALPLGPNCSALRDATRGQARIFDGSGGIFLVDTFRRGIVGTMPAADVVWAIVALWHALQQNDWERAEQIAGPLCQLVVLQMQAGLGGFVAIEKYLLVRQGVFHDDRCRHPTSWRLDPETAQEVDRLYETLRTVVPH